MKTTGLSNTPENEEVKSVEYKGDLLDKMEDEYFAKIQKNKKESVKNISSDHKNLQKNILVKIEELLSYQSQKNQEIASVLNYKSEEEIKQEQYQSKRHNVQDFRVKNRGDIDQYKDLSVQKKEIKEEQAIYEKKISDLYVMISEAGLTELEGRQFKRLISVDREEFEAKFDKDTQLQNIADMLGCDRSYVDEIWASYYGKGDHFDDDFGDNFRKLIDSMGKISASMGNIKEWELADYRPKLPKFNEQQKMFFASWFETNVEKTSEILNFRIDFS